MADLQGQIGELRMTIQVTHAETGKVEEFELIGTPLPEPEPVGDEPEKE